MKRMICLILALVMMATLVACGAKEEPVVTTATEVNVEIDEAVAPEETTEAPTEAVTEATEAPNTVMPVETVLIDNESCTFSVGPVSVSEMAGMQVNVTCGNKTQEALDFSWNNVSVCGMMYEPNWAVTVPAGETLTSQVEIDTYALETMGIQAVDEITFQLYVTSNENWMDAPYMQEYFTIYPTGLDADSVIYPVREEVASEVVLLDDDNLTFIAEFAEEQDLYYVVRCYILNKTQNTVMTSWENVQVNGLAVDPFWTTLVAPGKSAYAQVQFADSELKALGIDGVEEITFNLMAYDEAGETLVNESVAYEPVEEIALG